MSAGDTSEVMSNGKLVKPLSELSMHEVGIVREALKLGKYKETLINNEIDGKCLVECNTVEDVKEMGISLVVKARVFLNEVMTWKVNGVPMEYFSSDDQGTNRENNDAEDMIDEVKVDNHEDRKTNDDVDSEIMQGEAGTNGNDHEGSIVDDASIIESVVGKNHEDSVVDDNASCKVNG